MMSFVIRYELETDGRTIASVDQLPGCLAYGQDRQEARRNVIALAFAILGDMVEQGEWKGEVLPTVSFAEAA